MNPACYTGHLFTIGPLPSYASQPNIYLPQGSIYRLNDQGSGTYVFETVVCVGPRPSGWDGTVFTYLDANDSNHPLPDWPAVGNDPRTPRDPADRLYGKATLSIDGYGSYVYDLWFVPGRDAYLIDASQFEGHHSSMPHTNLLTLLAADEDTGLQNGAHD